MRKYKLAAWAVTGAVVIYAVVFMYVPYYVDTHRNIVVTDPLAATISPSARALHNGLFVADLHADSLLWNRNLLEWHSYGHIDLPRLLEGNSGLQVFSVVTKTPRHLNLHENDDTTDNITLLSIVERWPLQAVSSLYQRALFKANQLHQFAKDSKGQLRIIHTRSDFEDLLQQRLAGKKQVAAVLSLEGAQALEGKLDHLYDLYNVGYRIIGFTHFFDNELGGSAHGVQKGGITHFGHEVLKTMEQLHMTVDIAHASPRLIEDIFALSTRPVISTHTGVQAVCNDSPRNLTDAQLKQIAKSGGIVGIGFWPKATCSNRVEGVVRSIQYTIKLIGEDHVALGSDFDGNVQTPFDVAHIDVLTQALLDAGLTVNQIKKVMGGNAKRFFLENLPN